MTPLESAAKASWIRNTKENAEATKWEALPCDLRRHLIECQRAALLDFADAKPTEAMGNATVTRHRCGDYEWHIDEAKAYIRAGANEKTTEG